MIETIKSELENRIRVFGLEPCEYNNAKAEALREMLEFVNGISSEDAPVYYGYNVNP